MKGLTSLLSWISLSPFVSVWSEADCGGSILCTAACNVMRLAMKTFSLPPQLVLFLPVV